MNYTQEQIEQWKRKAEKWDALSEKIGRCYKPETKEDLDVVDPNGEVDWVDDADLATVGEFAAIAFGYL